MQDAREAAAQEQDAMRGIEADGQWLLSRSALGLHASVKRGLAPGMARCHVRSQATSHPARCWICHFPSPSRQHLQIISPR